MIPGRPPPEIPPPGVPLQPEPDPGRAPPSVPPMTAWSPDDPVGRLRADRRLLLTGALDHRAADHVCAELMAADGRAATPIELIINSTGGPADALLGLIDVVTLLRAPLATRCIGTAAGTAAVVLASGTGGRSAANHAAITLRIRDAHTIEGRADDIRRDADQIATVWDRIADHLATVSALTATQAAAELRDGGPLTLVDAAAAGLIDEMPGR